MPVKKEVTDAKYALVTWLIEKEKMTPEEISKLTPQGMMDHANKMNDELAQQLKTYINASAKLMQTEKLMFPNQRGGNIKVASLLYGLRKYLLEQGRSLAELGLTTKPSKPKNTKAITANDKEGIISGFADLFRETK